GSDTTALTASSASSVLACGPAAPPTPRRPAPAGPPRRGRLGRCRRAPPIRFPPDRRPRGSGIPRPALTRPHLPILDRPAVGHLPLQHDMEELPPLSDAVRASGFSAGGRPPPAMVSTFSPLIHSSVTPSKSSQ